MKKHLFWLAALVLSVAACTNDPAAEEGNAPAGPTDNGKSGLTTVKLATFAGDNSRVTYAAETRAEGDDALQLGELRLVASVANPSKSDDTFEKEESEDGRWMSATSVYYDATADTYYATYHMQGNNYNTQLNNDIAGAIQTFKVGADGTVELLDGFRAANPSKEDYDFNHIYFDNVDNRIIVVGHNWKVPSTYTGDEPYTGKRDNTRAIIGVFNPADGSLSYKGINTDEKEYVEGTTTSLGYKDAGDANCVVRAYDYKSYYVATRKGLAVLHAEADQLFNAQLKADGTNYFVKTPGSAKFVCNKGTESNFDLLYLAEETGKDLEYTTQSAAKVAHFHVITESYGTFGALADPADYNTELDPEAIAEYPNQTDMPAVISPVDGKNVLFALDNSDVEEYAALSTGGLYCRYSDMGQTYEKLLTFDNRPVNGVFAEENRDNESYTKEDGTRGGHNGFIYVANGSKLTIFTRDTHKEVVSWNMPSKDAEGNEVESSANYIVVTKGEKGSNGLCERTITVAYGQEGLRIFKFMPVLTY